MRSVCIPNASIACCSSHPWDSPFERHALSGATPKALTKFAPGEFVYVAKFAEAIYVLHAFVKKARQTAKRDITLAGTRYRPLLNQRKAK